MPSLSLTVRSLALAGFGLGAVPAFAQSANVTAFNPYDGVGAPAASGAAAVYAMPQEGPAGGPAFNPWNPGSSAGWSVSAGSPAASGGGFTGSGGASYSPGANLPAPPPGPIESRLTAVPERSPRAASVSAPALSRATVGAPVQPASAPPAPEPVVTRASPPAPVAPAARASAPVVAAAPAPPAPVVVAPARTPASAPAPTPVSAPARAAVASAPAAASVAPAGTPLTSITFGPQSAELSAAARADLDRTAQDVKRLRQVELRAYATGSDSIEARKIALARALSVRSYLIDQGVRSRIEVGAFASNSRGGERVDVIGQ